MAEGLANDFSTALNGAIATAPAAGTIETWTLDSLTGAPALPYRLRVDNEYVIVANHPSGLTVTVSRGADGSTPATHADDAVVSAVLTADGLADMASTDGLRCAVLRDDFQAPGIASLAVGELDWLIVGTVGTFVAAAAEANHPGITTIVSGASAGNIASLSLRAATTAAADVAVDWRLLAVVKTDSTLDANTGFRIGFTGDAAATFASPNANALYIEKKFADTDFFIRQRVATVETASSALLGASIAASTWYKLELWRQGATVYGRANGGTVRTLAVTLTGQLNVQIAAATNTTSARRLNADLFVLTLPLVR